ncbi:hypothetical protein ACP70R_002885 [Stipagrostis hirtigluma subsp. patula]
MDATTGAGKKPLATTASTQQQQQKQQVAVFAAKHRELSAEAAGVAREFGANVTTVAFLPPAASAGAGAPRAVKMEFRGGGGGELEAIRRLVTRDVSAMGLAEATAHEARLRALRAAVAAKLEEKKKKLAAAAAATAAGGKVVKREPEEQEQALGAAAGGKIRRVE